MTEDDTTSAFDAQIARIAVGAYDGAQDVRTAMLNRVRDVIRKRNEGIPFDEVEDEKDDEDRDWDSKYKDSNLPELVDQMLNEGKLNGREHQYISDALDAAHRAEEIESAYKDLMGVCATEPIYTEWLTNVYGVSTTITARMINRFGYCEKFDKVSNMWSYSGFAPGQERTRGEQLGYDPEAKTLGWIVADCMVKQGSNSRYRTEFYDPYKEKQIQRLQTVREVDGDVEVREVDQGSHSVPVTFGRSGVDSDGEPVYENRLFKGTAPNSRGHADNRAKRYLAKKFFKHYWAIARDLKGLDTPAEWIITHGGHDEQTDTFENPFHAKRVLQSP